MFHNVYAEPVKEKTLTATFSRVDSGTGEPFIACHNLSHMEAGMANLVKMLLPQLWKGNR
ncbi:MAG: hypothetical protein RDU01_09875 [Thermodesulfovibrionales bacterium]|nr:hypothetical protein [Thermodesulfovibrionales bacterium]